MLINLDKFHKKLPGKLTRTNNKIFSEVRKDFSIFGFAICSQTVFLQKSFNPFVANAPFLYPQKISENLLVFYCFQGLGKGCIGGIWVKCGAI